MTSMMKVGILSLNDGGTETLVTDELTIDDNGFFVVAAESGTTDDLSTITYSVSGVTSGFVVLRADSGDTIIVKHGVDNISLNDASDFALSADKTVMLFFDGTVWTDVGAGVAGSADWANPGTIGSTTPNTGVFTTLTAETKLDLDVNGVIEMASVGGITPFLNDNFGNELIVGYSGGASSVNYVLVTNTITGGPPTVAAWGDDTNIDLRLTGKGTGRTETDGMRSYLTTELTISGGAVTMLNGRHTIDTEGDAASDDLDTISGGTDGDLLFISPNHTDRTIVVKHGTGNIYMLSESDLTLDSTEKALLLLYVSAVSAWLVIGGAGGGSGTVTSVALALPGEFSVSGSPITTSGTLTGAWANQNANEVFSGPSSGVASTPGFRTMVSDDVPALPASKIASGTLDNARVNWAAPSDIGSTTPPDITADILDIIASTELTISGGSVTVTHSAHTIDTEGDAASDDLDTISGGTENWLLFIRPAHTDRSIVVKHSTGNIYTLSGTDITLDSTEKSLALICDGTNWHVLGDGAAGGGGGGTVTSVGLIATPTAVFDVGGSPVTTSGNITLSMDNQTANTMLAGPTTGAAAEPAFRALVDADIPGLDASKIDAGTLVHERGGLQADVSGYDGIVRITGGATSALSTPLALDYGGTEAALDATGPGALVQTAGGAAVTVETLDETRGGTAQTTYTKGDVLAGTAADTLGKLGVGANGDLIVADSGESTGLKYGDHGDINGLGDDDHTQYLLADGTRGLSADWNAGAHKITAETLASDVAIGTAPLDITSTTMVPNLNADQVDGIEGAALALVAGDVYTGTHDFGGADDLEIPNSGTPTVDTAGQVAIDTTVADYTGMIKYHDGVEELVVVAMPTANLSTTDGYVVAYDAANNELKMVAQSGGSATLIGCVATRTSDLSGSTSYVSMPFTTEDWDTDTMHDGGGANPERITINTAGKYVIVAGVYNYRPGVGIQADGTAAKIMKNGTTAIGILEFGHGSYSVLFANGMTIAAFAELEEDDYLTLDVKGQATSGRAFQGFMGVYKIGD